MYRDLWTIIFDFLGTCPKKDGQVILDDHIPMYAFANKMFLDIYFCGLISSLHEDLAEDRNNGRNNGRTEDRNTIEQIFGYKHITWRRQARNDFMSGIGPRSSLEIIGHTIESFTAPIVEEHDITRFKMMATMLFLQPTSGTTDNKLSNRQIYIILHFLHRMHDEDLFITHLMRQGEPFHENYTIIGADTLLKKYPQTKLLNLLLQHHDSFPMLRTRTDEVTAETRALLFRRFCWTVRENDLRIYHMPHDVRTGLIVFALILFFPVTILCLPAIILRIIGTDSRVSILLGSILSSAMLLSISISAIIIANALGHL